MYQAYHILVTLFKLSVFIYLPGIFDAIAEGIAENSTDGKKYLILSLIAAILSIFCLLLGIYSVKKEKEIGVAVVAVGLLFLAAHTALQFHTAFMASSYEYSAIGFITIALDFVILVYLVRCTLNFHKGLLPIHEDENQDNESSVINLEDENENDISFAYIDEKSAYIKAEV